MRTIAVIGAWAVLLSAVPATAQDAPAAFDPTTPQELHERLTEPSATSQPVPRAQVDVREVPSVNWGVEAAERLTEVEAVLGDLLSTPVEPVGTSSGSRPTVVVSREVLEGMLRDIRYARNASKQIAQPRD